MIDTVLFARCFVATACEKGVQEFGNIMAYAKLLFPEKEEKNAAQKLYDIIKKSNKTGKPQSVPLELATLMVSLLPGVESFASFCFTVEQKVLAGYSMSDYLEFQDRVSHKKRKKDDREATEFTGVYHGKII